MQVEAEKIMTKDTDDRGRIYLGTEYADKQVTVGVLEVKDPDDTEP